MKKDLYKNAEGLSYSDFCALDLAGLTQLLMPELSENATKKQRDAAAAEAGKRGERLLIGSVGGWQLRHSRGMPRGGRLRGPGSRGPG